MSGIVFQDQASGFADALLTSRTTAILYRMSQEGKLELSADDAEVIKRTITMLSSGLAGLQAAEGHPPLGEMGFLEWMENLRHFEAVFDASIRSKLTKKGKDVPKAVISAKKGLEEVLHGTVPSQIEEMIKFFSSISDVNLDVALDSNELPPQELSAPQEVGSA